jgi:hypothetical protein
VRCEEHLRKLFVMSTTQQAAHTLYKAATTQIVDAKRATTARDAKISLDPRVNLEDLEATLKQMFAGVDTFEFKMVRFVRERGMKRLVQVVVLMHDGIIKARFSEELKAQKNRKAKSKK